MLDAQIRQALRDRLSRVHRADPHVVIKDEFSLCLGSTRVDLAVLNGSITGFEIKSHHDRLDRLGEQVRLYSQVLDQAVLVTAPRHVARAVDLLEPWWGVWVARLDHDKIEFDEIRSPGWNSARDRYAIAQLLWREEAFSVLREENAHAGLSRATRFKLWRILADAHSADDLRDHALRAIKARPTTLDVE